MSWREAAVPRPMARVALVAPRGTMRDVLARVASLGVVQLDEVDRPGATGTDGGGGRDRQAEPVVALDAGDRAAWEREGRTDLLAGEAELDGLRSAALTRGRAAALAGWCPVEELPRLRAEVGGIGGAVVELDRPRGVEPPTQLRQTPASRPFAPLVQTYTTVPYRDLDPTLVSGLAYVLMFGMMFGDVGHGAMLLAGGLALRAGHPRVLARLEPSWPLVAGAGLAAMVFGVLYGEAFGPTGLVPVLWLSPLETPVPLLLAAVGLGAVLLAGAYALGIVNRLREGGVSLALYSPSGIAGASLFLGAGLAAGGWYLGVPWLAGVGAAVAAAGLALSFVGLLAEAGVGAAGVVEAVVELVDVVVRLGSNVASFARLAAFGLTHAALGLVVWQGTTALWGTGSGAAAVAAAVGAVLVFVLGNALAFALEALIAGIQALRLEYYELFSRVFRTEGRPFRPWQLPVVALKEM